MSNETALDLDAIEARAGAATKGSWYGSGGALVIYGATPGDEVATFRRRDDAAFAKHARTDVPALVAEVKSLRTELAQEEREHSKSLDIMEAACDQRNAAIARAEAAEAAHRALLERVDFLKAQTQQQSQRLAQMTVERNAAEAKVAAGLTLAGEYEHDRDVCVSWLHDPTKIVDSGHPARLSLMAETLNTFAANLRTALAGEDA